MKIIINKYSKAILASLSLLAVVSCSDPWDDHAKSSDDNLKQNLGERLTSISETSEFGKLLTETGYDRVLTGTKTYTVWAPTNAAMAAVPASELANLESKKLFVSNHIALTSVGSVSTQDTVTVQMMSNKYLEFIGGEVMDGAPVVTPDQYTSNGLYHIVSDALVPRSNIWEYIKSMNGSNAMSTYLVSLNEFNIYPSDSTAKATAEAISPAIIYSDSLTNSYLRNVYNLNNEKNKYTFFLLEDDAYNAEVTKLEPYLTKSNADSTTTYASYFNVRDFAFHKSVSQENLPDTLVSRFGVKVPIDKDNIIEQVNLSNGVLYVMSSMDVPLETRLLTTQIEGERPVGFSQGDKRGNTFYREKEDLDGVAFEDIMVQNHGVPLFTIYYRAPDLYSTTYKVYWRAINDIQSNTFQQRVRIGGGFNELGEFVDEIATLNYTDVAPNVYDEVYVGEFYIDQLGSINNELISLIAANSASNGVNTLTLDYIKLVPVIK
ncbi:fasciclin domain-containing protein [Aestuariibaculum sp. M13]|uniref:fasciclin domain-containing protein n=1 Tax=Aestuariibaculum sp. M13 TaxID=2967132 RepID=UPI002159D444|nr:fasciclin domain-containing protein [Aestuariibaculum sp. M13]MCR8666805.1 fasciclin domain-containing protein [Aestuariibaculum sp. M13]